MIVCEGDSWTYGSEIVAPEFLAKPDKKDNRSRDRIIKGFNDSDTRNDYYRIPRAWPSILAGLLNEEVINRSIPGGSNDRIVKSVVSWIYNEYIPNTERYKKIKLIIGWTSPERKDFIIEDDGNIYDYIIWPNGAKQGASWAKGLYRSRAAKEYFDFFVNHLWTEYETLPRFVNQVLFVKTLCQAHNIDLYMFNAFWTKDDPNYYSLDIKYDFTLSDSLKKLSLVAPADRYAESLGGCGKWQEEIQALINVWDSVNEKEFIFKDKETFKSVIEANIDIDNRWYGVHPSEKSHKLWAETLYKHITSYSK